MQLVLTFSTLLALVCFVAATPASSGFKLSARDPAGVYVFDRTGVAFTPLSDLRRTEASNPVTRKTEPAALQKRDSYNCFNAGVDGGKKWTAVNQLYTILDDFPSVPANSAIAAQYEGNSIAYVCNNANSAVSSNAQDVISYDTGINNQCGSSTAGRVKLDSGLEYGRTAAGKSFCDGS